MSNSIYCSSVQGLGALGAHPGLCTRTINTHISHGRLENPAQEGREDKKTQTTQYSLLSHHPKARLQTEVRSHIPQHSYLYFGFDVRVSWTTSFKRYI